MSVSTYYCSTQGNQKIAGTRFTVNDFKQKDNACDMVLIDCNLAVLLQCIENHFGKQININSGYRSPAYNAKVGGAEHSYHIEGQAADISISDISLSEIARYADYKLGQKGGVGVYTDLNFVHVDTRGYPSYWKYTGWRGTSYQGSSADPPLNLNIDNSFSGGVLIGSGQAALKPQREVVIELPSGLGKTYTYETWNREEYGYKPWILDSNQKKLITLAESRGERRYDSEGYGYVGQRYAVAMTSTFGEIGDYVDIYCVDGRIIHGILGDEKDQTTAHGTPANKWGHENGQVVVEFMTNWPADPVHLNPPGNGGVTKVINLGNYFEYPEYASGFGGSYSGTGSAAQSLPITKTVEKSRVGGNGVVRKNPVVGTMTPGGITELYIVNHGGTIYQPVVEGTITLKYYRKGSPSSIEFNVLKTKELDFKEGAQVIFKSKDVNMFYGYVFEKSRSKTGIINVKAYDQLRYFKNKDCYVYSDKTATELVQMIAEDYNLTVLENQPETGYKIPLRVEDNNTLFDIVQNAFDLTLINTGELYVLYDDFGTLTIRSPKSWIYDYVLDEETAEDFSYKTSIDNNVATRIKLYYDNGSTGERETYIHNNEEKINEFGVLQYCEALQDGEDGVKNAETLSILYSDKIRTLSAKNAIGNPHIRAGCSIFVNLNLGDIIQQHFMVCETVTHKFSNCKHFMDISLIGGDFRE